MAFLGASRLLWAADPPNQPHMLAKGMFEVGGSGKQWSSGCWAVVGRASKSGRFCPEQSASRSIKGCYLVGREAIKRE